MELTPPWRVDAWKSADGLAKLVQQLEAIGEILDDEDVFGIRNEAISGWSVGEHAGHLALATGRMGMAVEKSLADPTRDCDQRSQDFLDPILVSGDFPRGVAEAPPATVAVERERAELQDLLAETARRWEDLAGRQAEIASCPSRVRHHRFGYLTAREWLRLATVHNAHHLLIVSEIRRSPKA